MNWFENIKNFFNGKISDEEFDLEIAAHEWIMCPKCSVNIMKEDLIDNDWVCPNCSTKIHFVDKESENN